LSKGIGVAVVVENTSGAAVTVPRGGAALRLEGVELAFTPRPRNDDVQV
jgi:hypothetical protein